MPLFIIISVVICIATFVKCTIFNYSTAWADLIFVSTVVYILVAENYEKWASHGKYATNKEYVKQNPYRYLKISTIYSLFFWLAIVLIAAWFISGWFLLAGAISNCVYVVRKNIDVLGEPPKPEYIDLE